MTKPLHTLITPALAICGLLVLAFYLLLFMRGNSAPVVDLASFKGSATDGFRYQVERCRINGKKISVSGWLVREGRGPTARSLRVIALDAAGVPHALKTSWVQRDDVSELLAGTLADGVGYQNAGFAASINLRAAGVEFDRAPLYLAYDDGRQRALLPVTCPAEPS